MVPTPIKTYKLNVVVGLPKFDIAFEYIVESGASYHITCIEKLLKIL